MSMVRVCRVVVSSLVFSALIGCGAEQGGVLLARSLDFGDVPAGLDVQQLLLVQNVGTGRARLRGLLSSENLVGPTHRFRVEGTTRDVAAGGETRVPITFTALGLHDEPVQATLRFETDDEPLTVRLTGRGVPEGIRIDPQPLDFGAVLIGSDRTQELTVTNALQVPVELTTALDVRGAASFEISEGTGRFELLSPVEASGSLIPGDNLLQPGQSQRFQIRYTPSPVDGRIDRARWAIAHCPSPACTAVVQLEGRARETALTCDPSPLVVRAAIGAAETRPLRCTNDSAGAVQVTGWRFAPGAPVGLGAEPPPGSTVLQPGEAIAIDVRFAALAPRGRRAPATLIIDAVDPRTRRQLSPVEHPVEAIAGRAIAELATACDFGEVPAGTTGRCLLDVHNRGDEPLVLDPVITAGEPPFALEPGERTIAPGASGAVLLRLDATRGTGIREGALVVRTNDDQRPEVGVALSGVVLDGEPCSLQLSHATLELGLVNVGQAVRRTVRATNVGPSRCDIAGIRFLSPDPAFTLVSPGRSSIEPGASRLIEVAFQPVAEGVAFASVEVLVATASGDTPLVTLRGQGGASALSASPRALELGPRPAGCGPIQVPITVFNDSGRTVRIDAARLEAESAPAWSLAAPGAPPPVELEPGARHTFTALLTDPPLGELLAALIIESAGAAGPLVVPIHVQISALPQVEDRLDVPERRPVDVLFVVNAAFAFSTFVQRLTAAFPTFVTTAATLGADWQVGVINTDMAQCPAAAATRPARVAEGACGYLAQADQTSRRVITADEAETPESAFARVLMFPSAPASIDRGLDAVTAALTAPISTGWNDALLRAGADVALVFVSNQDDLSARNTVAVVSDLAATQAAGSRLTAWGLVGQPRDACAIGGTRYTEVATLLGGATASVCALDWSLALEAFARGIFSGPDRIVLSTTPDTATLVVLIDGSPVPASAWTYDPLTNAVLFSEAARPEPDAQVVARYRAVCGP